MTMPKTIYANIIFLLFVVFWPRVIHLSHLYFIYFFNKSLKNGYKASIWLFNDFLNINENAFIDYNIRKIIPLEKNLHKSIDIIMKHMWTVTIIFDEQL